MSYRIPVYLPLMDGKPQIGKAVVYDDGVVLVELNQEGVGNTLRKMLIEGAISGISISGDEVQKGTGSDG